MYPRISIVITASNDPYFGLGERLDRALTSFHRALGDISELVFVEWNPFPEYTLRSTGICRKWPAWARCFVVSSDFAALGGSRQFAEFPAKNVGIRRSQGEFILSANADIVCHGQVHARMRSQSLTSGVLYRAQRIDLNPGFMWTGEDFDPASNPHAVVRPPGFGPGDFTLMDRGSWHALRGHTEEMPDHHYHKDGLLLNRGRELGMRTEFLGVIYHWAHPSRPGIRQTPKPPMETLMSLGHYDDWGLANAHEVTIDGISVLMKSPGNHVISPSAWGTKEE